MDSLQKRNKRKAIAKSGPSLYETEYLNEVVKELKLFLQSKNVTTVHDIYLGFQGDGYQGRMLLSKGA